MSEAMRIRVLRRGLAATLLALVVLMGVGICPLRLDVVGATPSYAYGSDDVDYYFESDRDLLPGDSWSIDDYLYASYYVSENSYWEYTSCRVLNIEIVSGAELLESFEYVEDDEDGLNHWSYTARDLGTTTFKVTYETVDGGEDSYTFNSTTKSGVIDLDCWVTSEGGSTCTLPGGSISLQASAVFRQGRGPEDTEGITYEWALEDDYDGHVTTITTSTNADGSSSAKVTFGSEGWFGYSQTVVVTARKGDVETSEEIRLCSSEDYSELWFKELNTCLDALRHDPYWLPMGESLAITPELRHYSRETGGYELREIKEMRWCFDKDALAVTDASGNAVQSLESVVPSGAYTLTRSGSWGGESASLYIVYDSGDGEEVWNDYFLPPAADSHLEFSWKNPGHLFVDSPDSSATIALDDDLPRDAAIEWTVGPSDDQGLDGLVFTEGTEYEVKGKTLTLKGAEIMKHASESTVYGHKHGYDVCIYAQVKSSSGAVLCDGYEYVYVSEAGEEYRQVQDTDLLLGDYDGVVSREGAHIWSSSEYYGDEVEYSVTDVQLVSGADVLDLERHSDDDGDVWWDYHAKKLGDATLRVSYRRLDGSADSYTFDVHVVDTAYYLEVDKDKMREAGASDYRLLPGETGELWMRGWRRSVVRKEDGHGGYWFEREESTDGLEYRWRLTGDDRLATMTVDEGDPTHAMVNANRLPENHHYELIGYEGYVDAVCELYCDGKLVADTNYDYDIRCDYYAVKPGFIADPGLFESTTVSPSMVYRHLDADDNPVEEAVTQDKVEYSWSFDKDCWRITNANGEEVDSYEGWDDDGASAGPGPYTITRINAYSDDISLKASYDRGEWTDWASAWYDMDFDYDAYRLSFDRDWYEATEGTPAVIKLDLSSFAAIPEGERTATLGVGVNWDPESGFEEELPASAYSVRKDGDSWTITVPFEAAGRLADERHSDGVYVYAEMVVGDGILRRDEVVFVSLPSSAPFFVDADPADTNNHGAEVEWMARSGISEGWVTADGRREFRGMENVTRCDFAAFLYRLADLSDDGARNDSIKLSDAQVAATLATVSDCDARTPHAAEVAWLVNTGISRGWADKGGKTVSFRPMAKVARQDMAAFLYRFADLQDNQKQDRSLKKGAEQVTFKDVRPGDEANHASEVEWLASVGVTKGWKVGSKYEFRGTRTVARQDMAAFMYRLNGYLHA